MVLEMDSNGDSFGDLGGRWDGGFSMVSNEARFELMSRWSLKHSYYHANEMTEPSLWI